MSYTDDQRQRIANAVKEAREGKGLDKEPAARAAKINSITWKRVEDGLGVRDSSLSKILASLDLPSAASMLAEYRGIAGAGSGEQTKGNSSVRPLPPLSEVQPFRGTNSLRWRAVIEQKPDSERTQEEAAWLAASKAEQSRLTELAQRQGVDDLGQVVEDDDWIPADAPASRQPRWSPFRSRSFEEIFNEWQVARANVLNLELEYAIGRHIDPDIAAEELVDVLDMFEQNRRGTGRPWTPPWDPGDQFEPGEEPWNSDWWITFGPSPEIPGVTRVSLSSSWDVERVRRERSALPDEPKARERATDVGDSLKALGVDSGAQDADDRA